MFGTDTLGCQKYFNVWVRHSSVNDVKRTEYQYTPAKNMISNYRYSITRSFTSKVRELMNWSELRKIKYCQTRIKIMYSSSLL